MGMISDEDSVKTLELIQDTTRKAQKARLLPELSGDGRRAFVQHGDQIKEFELRPATRRHTVHSLVDLILFARRETCAKPIVWHSDDGVTLLVDDADRRDYVHFPLTASRRFNVLRTLAGERPWLAQPEFVRTLRVDLGLDNVKIVAKFRKLDWSLTNDGGGDVQHGASKMSKAVLAKVQGIDELPDQLAVEVPVYQQMGERQAYIVQCAVEIDAVNQRLQLLPFPDELERVVDLAQTSIHDRLTVALGEIDGLPAIPVFYGKP